MEGIKLKADELVMKIRSEFESAISKKTGWGRNEIMIQLDAAIAKVSLEALRNNITDD
jgi:hypothetical protein